jgi:putative NADH-flavin reductase
VVLLLTDYLSANLFCFSFQGGHINQLLICTLYSYKIKKMNILILGATGGTGQQLVKQSLEQNHEVTALTRDPSKLKQDHKNLIKIEGNVLDKDVLMKALEGKDAVVSALGVGKSLKSNGLISSAVSLLIPAMNIMNVDRLIFLSAFGVGETFGQANFIQRIIFKLILRNIYFDKSEADSQIRRSTLEWTLVYPVTLTDGIATGKYKTGIKFQMKGMPRISRTDVAEFMLRQLTDNLFVKKSVIIMS